MGQDAAIKNSYGNYLMNSNTKIVTLCKNHQETLKKTYDIDATIIPWHIDISDFPDLQENTIDILGVGSLNAIKNYSDFIDIISTLSKTHKNLNVVIIGNGELRSKIEKKIQNLQLENIITLTGMLPRIGVLKMMAQSKILLHTSMYESFGFVFLEALYSGMHVVSHNVGLATAAQNWHIGNDKAALIEACEKLLTLNNTDKKRSSLSSENETINAYLSLYHA
jgi:glycosyltransferase involved in cell wall biosynthesis